MQIEDLSGKVKFLGAFISDSPNSDSPSEYMYALPSSRNLRWIIPISGKIMTSSLALYQPSLTRAKILKGLAVFLVRIGLAKLIFRDHVYFEKNDGEVQKIFSRSDLKYAVFTGTEGSHRKITVQVMDSKGTILGYIKVADSEAIEQLLDNEADILGNLSRLGIKSGLFPKVIYQGELKGTKVLILDTLKSTMSTFSNRLSEKHIMFLSELFHKSSKIFKFSDSPFSTETVSRLAVLDSLDYSWRERFTRAFDYISRSIGETEIPFGICHRDFTPWNTFFHNDQLYVFDWEYARRYYPPLLDVFHFIVQDGILVRKLTPFKLIKRILKHKELLSKYSRLVGIKNYLWMPLFVCYLLDISFLYIEREKGNVEGEIKSTVETWGQMMEMIVRGY